MLKKRLGDYGVILLDELEQDRSEFHKGKMKTKKAQTVAILANATSRALRASLMCRKFEK